MNESKVAFTEDDEVVSQLKTLKEGDDLYSPEFEHTPEGGGRFEVRHFTFKAYEKRHEANHTEVDLNEDEAIMATIIDPRFPTVEVPNIDLSVGFYLKKDSAVRSFFEGMIEIVDTIKKFAEENEISLATHNQESQNEV